MAAEDKTVDASAEQPRSKFGKWLPKLKKGSLAIADQGVFAVSNFLLNVLLVRWLSPDDYGAFALVYSVFISLLLIHGSLFTTPMLVFGQGKYRERFPEYLGILLRGHFALMIPGSLLLIAAAFLLGKYSSLVVGHAFLALAAGAPFILLLWLLRRAFYAQLDPVWAAASGVVYMVTLIASTVAIHSFGNLTPALAFLGIAAASLVTSVILLIRLRPKLTGLHSSTMRAVAIDHWDYGKWVAAGAGPNWITDSIYFIVLPAWHGLAQAGALKALFNLAQPASQSISALGVLLTPLMVRDRAVGGSKAMAKTIKWSSILLITVCTAYTGLLWAFRTQLFHSLYGNKFSGYGSWPLLAVGLVPIAQVIPNVAGAALGAIERPKLGFWADSWSAGFTLVVGVGLAFWLGVGGALIGITLSYTLMGVLSLVFYYQAVRKDGLVTNQPAAAIPGPPNWTETL